MNTLFKVNTLFKSQHTNSSQLEGRVTGFSPGGYSVPLPLNARQAPALFQLKYPSLVFILGNITTYYSTAF